MAVSFHVDGLQAGGNVCQVTFRNNSDACVKFNPVAVGDNGGITGFSNMLTLGQTIDTVSLPPGAQETLFYAVHLGTQTVVVRDERAC